MSELIRNFGYVGLIARDLDEWRVFASTLGLQEVEGSEESPPDCAYFRMDDRSYRIVVEQGEATDRVAFMGFEVASGADLEQLVSRIEAAGHDVSMGSGEDCSKRQVTQLAYLDDPFGNRIELFVGQREATEPFVSPTGARFVTGDEGFGHAMLLVSDVDEFMDFYVDGLGFRISDTIGGAVFLHCSPRHHSLAAVTMPDVENSLSHIMLQVESLDAVGRALDELERQGVELATTLGKHTNDHMVSFYCKAPSGVLVEYGTGGRRIDDDQWVVGNYSATSYWGHKRPGAPSPS